MLRVLLESRGDVVELSDGVTTLGRDASCRIRFNDSTVSRRHASIRVLGGDVTIEDRGSVNGTMVNGARLTAMRSLRDGDVLRLGDRTRRVRVTTRAGELDYESDEVTSDRLEAVAAPILPKRENAAARSEMRNCATCRASIHVTAARCEHCGRTQSTSRIAAVTAEVTRPESRKSEAQTSGIHERRVEMRRAVHIPVLFQSDVLTFEAVARDVSASGMFVETDLLEPVGTPCRVTVLPDGAPAITVDAVVSRVVEQANGETTAAGLGLTLSKLDSESELWLRRVIGRLDVPAATAQMPAAAAERQRAIR